LIIGAVMLLTPLALLSIMGLIVFMEFTDWRDERKGRR
jgi:hypothetical protein